MTKEDFDAEVYEYAKSRIGTEDSRMTDRMLAYRAGAESREKQIQIDAEQIRALQKQNGELTDKVKELEAQVIRAFEVLEGKRKRIAELEQENELLKADVEFNAKQSTKKSQTVKKYQELVDEYSSEGADLQERIKELEQENKVLAQNLEDTEIVNKAIEKENAELKGLVNQYKASKCGSISLVNRNMIMFDQLTKAKEFIKLLLMNCVGVYESTGKTIAEIQAEAEQFLKGVEK